MPARTLPPILRPPVRHGKSGRLIDGAARRSRCSPKAAGAPRRSPVSRLTSTVSRSGAIGDPPHVARCRARADDADGGADHDGGHGAPPLTAR